MLYFSMLKNPKLTPLLPAALQGIGEAYTYNEVRSPPGRSSLGDLHQQVRKQ